MPQFDFSTYLSQIFWFGLCFITLYIFAQFSILPRLKNIISKRNDLIETDKSLASELDNKTLSINDEAQQILQKANSDYLHKIDEITKKAHAQREESIEHLKSKIDDNVRLSRLEIKKFITESKINNSLLIENLTKFIKNKIIN
ncbi:MAG: hypothetical protein FJX30_01300 [Alphaproteobacteria bacterium]|nr:hypothetical protein [Alphaproteobacteria bacterium]